MNVYLMVDAEGISGIYTSSQVAADGERFSELRHYMTQDINACVEGLKEGGAEKIMVYDCHGASNSVIWDQLTPLAEGYICGTQSYGRMPYIDEYDAIVLLGYHAKAGTPGAVLEHTMSSAAWQNCWINGELAGEVQIDASIAGEHGLPVIMVSGDDKVCAEAQALIENVVTVQVKTGLSSFGAILMPCKKAHDLIKEKAAEALRNAVNVKPLVAKVPVTIRLELLERQALPSQLRSPFVKIIDGRTYEVTANSVEEALMRL